jgi:hypothetical protein
MDPQANASILLFLKTHGEKLDAEIATALRMPMTLVKTHMSQLSSVGEVVCCKVTRYIDGEKIEGVSCRLSCNIPAPARGRKPGAKRNTGREANEL